jgi:hypothetical protein
VTPEVHPRPRPSRGTAEDRNIDPVHAPDLVGPVSDVVAAPEHLDPAVVVRVHDADVCVFRDGGPVNGLLGEVRVVELPVAGERRPLALGAADEGLLVPQRLPVPRLDGDRRAPGYQVGAV